MDHAEHHWDQDGQLVLPSDVAGQHGDGDQDLHGVGHVRLEKAPDGGRQQGQALHQHAHRIDQPRHRRLLREDPLIEQSGDQTDQGYHGGGDLHRELSLLPPGQVGPLAVLQQVDRGIRQVLHSRPSSGQKDLGRVGPLGQHDLAAHLVEDGDHLFPDTRS